MCWLWCTIWYTSLSLECVDLSQIRYKYYQVDNMIQLFQDIFVTMASNLGYLETARTIFHGCQIVYWDPLNAKRSCPQNKFGMGYVKMYGFQGTHCGFENEDMPTKLRISQLLLILDYWTDIGLISLCCICKVYINWIVINIYENIKNVIHEWGYTHKINTISSAFSHRLLKFVLN